MSKTVNAETIGSGGSSIPQGLILENILLACRLIGLQRKGIMSGWELRARILQY